MGPDRGPILTSNTLAFGIVTFCFVILRIGYRLHTKKTSASDWILAVALASSLAQDAFNAACITQWGYGHHNRYLSSSIRSSPEPLKLLWLNQVFFKVTTMCTKLSICLLYFGIFKRANSRLFQVTRMVTFGTTLLIIGYYVPAFLVSIFQCTPVSKSWHSKELGTCIDLNEFRFYTAAANIITSVLVIATPLPVLSKMRHTRPEITGLIGLILLGMVHTGCTIVRLVLMVYPDPVTKTDPQWANITPLTIAIVEMDVGIIAASLIVMYPFFKAIRSSVLKRCHFHKISFTRSSPYNTSSRISRLLRSKGITVTVDVELESQRVSSHEVTPKDMV